MRPPRFDESLDFGDGGAFSLWRSVGWASSPASPIGRFGGVLTPGQRRELASAADGAAADGSRSWPIRPDSPVDRLWVVGGEATLGIHDQPEGPWGALALTLRALLHDLTASPVAALALEAADGPHLVHLGPQELPLDLTALTVEAVHWRAGDSLGQWKSDLHEDVAGGSPVRAGTGWRLALPFSHGFALQPGDRVSTRVGVGVGDGDRWVRAALFDAGEEAGTGVDDS